MATSDQAGDRTGSPADGAFPYLPVQIVVDDPQHGMRTVITGQAYNVRMEGEGRMPNPLTGMPPNVWEPGIDLDVSLRLRGYLVTQQAVWGDAIAHATQDALEYGVGFVRRLPDGRLERVDPTTIEIRTKD